MGDLDWSWPSHSIYNYTIPLEYEKPEQQITERNQNIRERNFILTLRPRDMNFAPIFLRKYEPLTRLTIAGNDVNSHGSQHRYTGSDIAA